MEAISRFTSNTVLDVCCSNAIKERRLICKLALFVKCNFRGYTDKFLVVIEIEHFDLLATRSKQ